METGYVPPILQVDDGPARFCASSAGDSSLGQNQPPFQNVCQFTQLWSAAKAWEAGCPMFS